MAYQIMNPRLGAPEIGTVQVAGYTAPWKLGDIVQAHDPVYGVGEFIYVKGGTSVAAGLMCKYSGADYAITLLAAGDAESGVPVGVATAALDATTKFGWLQISGHAVVYKTAVIAAADAAIFISGTSGRFKVIASTGKGILGAQVVASVSAGVSSTTVLLNRPKVAGFES